MTTKKFKEIETNYEEIDQTKLNIEDRTRTNLFAWNGQFSPQFIEALLDKYSETNFLVIDPFVGSGTTLIECARKNLKSYGIELNVAPYLMAKTYELVNYSIESREKIIDKIDNFILMQKDDELIIDNLKNEINNSEDKEYVTILSTLVILMDIYNKNVNTGLLNKNWEKLRNIILELPFSKNKIIVDRGDARYIPLNNDTADLLITSPPYINVFNYHQKYRKSVEALDYNVLSIAKKEFGSNRKNRSNRILTAIQYCIDMSLSINEAIRVCKKDARMIYVVGRESAVLGYSFRNSELIYNICTEIFDLRFEIKQERVFKNRYGKMIYEDILHFLNNKNFIDDEEYIIKQSKLIAKKYLIKLLEETDENEKNRKYLEEAIKKVGTVKKSEV